MFILRAAPGDVPDAKRQDTKRDHIVFVGNVCVDICVYVDQFPKEDSKSRTNEVVNRRGGNASTSAIGILQKRLNASACFV